MIPYSRPKLSDLYILSQNKLLENHTLHSCGTYLYSPYMAVTPQGLGALNGFFFLWNNYSKARKKGACSGKAIFWLPPSLIATAFARTERTSARECYPWFPCGCYFFKNLIILFCIRYHGTETYDGETWTSKDSPWTEENDRWSWHHKFGCVYSE